MPEAAIKLSDGFLLRPAQSQFNFLWLMNANNIVMTNFTQNNSYVDVPDRGSRYDAKNPRIPIENIA